MENEVKRQMSLGVILSYAVIIAQFATGLLYTPIVLKTLGQSQYGVYSLCTSFIGYLTLMNSGANAAYIRFYVQTKVNEPKKISSLNGTFLKIFVVLAFLALLGGWFIGIFSPIIFGDKISTEEYTLVKTCFKFLALNTSVQVINCVFSSLIIANERFIFAKIVHLIVAILNPVLTLPFLFAGYSCVSVIVVHLATMTITLLINILYCIRTLGVCFDLKQKDNVLLKNILQFAGFIVLQSIMDQINWQIDKFILARTHGTKEISLYSVGATFNRYYITFAAALSNVFIAQINRLQAKNDKENINKLFIRSSRVFAYCVWLFITAFIIFGNQFVVRWAGNEYGSSFLIGILLMLPVTVSLTMGLAQDIARAMNKHQLQIIINFAICIINGIVSIPLAVRWGAHGSAFGTFVAEICMCLVAEPLYYKKILGLDMKQLFTQLGKIVPGLIIPILYGMIIINANIIKPNYANIAVLGGLYIIIYLISMWIFAFNKSEKIIVRRVFSKIHGYFTGRSK